MWGSWIYCESWIIWQHIHSISHARNCVPYHFLRYNSWNGKIYLWSMCIISWDRVKCGTIVWNSDCFQWVGGKRKISWCLMYWPIHCLFKQGLSLDQWLHKLLGLWQQQIQYPHYSLQLTLLQTWSSIVTSSDCMFHLQHTWIRIHTSSLMLFGFAGL